MVVLKMRTCSRFTLHERCRQFGKKQVELTIMGRKRLKLLPLYYLPLLTSVHMSALQLFLHEIDNSVEVFREKLWLVNFQVRFFTLSFIYIDKG